MPIKPAALLFSTTASATLLLTPIASADHHMEMQFVPSHANTCSFRDGKGRGDLEKLNESFKKFAENGASDYSYWILTPRFREDSDLDFVWLGTWPSFASMGEGFDNWVESAADLEQMFIDTAECSSSMMAITPISAAADKGPEHGVTWFTRCTLEEGKGLDDAIAAHAEGWKALGELGNEGSSWAFVPALGVDDNEFDYYEVASWESYAALGAFFEGNVNKAGWKKRAAAMDGVASCVHPDLYDHNIMLQGQRQ